MELFGIHGTTVSCANKIEQEGFKLSQQGYRGTGLKL